MPRIPAVLRDEAQFRLLFAGQALSVIGDRLTFVVLPFAVLSTGGGLKEVGLVAAATTVPFVLFTLAAGVWADRLDRRRIMLASDAVRLVAQALAGVLLLAGVAEWWHLALIALAYGTADAFFQPAMYGLMPQIVSMGQLQSANALRGLSLAVGTIAGPALAGVLLVVLEPGGALLVDAATFAVSIGFLLRLRPATVESATEPEPRFLDGLRGGWREVRSRDWVWSMLGGLAVYHAVVLPSVFALGPVLADRELGGATDWALITVGFGAGSILGQLLLLRWRPRRPLRASAACLIGASMQAAIIGSGLPVPAIAGLEALAGICVQCYFTLWETSIQEQVPIEAVSRVGSYDFLVSTGLIPLGTVIAAPVGEALGLQPTLIGMSVIGVGFALVVLSVPSVRRLERPAALP
jgi:predicted MFS family arabinose efflux permease